MGCGGLLPPAAPRLLPGDGLVPKVLLNLRPCLGPAVITDRVA